MFFLVHLGYQRVPPPHLGDPPGTRTLNLLIKSRGTYVLYHICGVHPRYYPHIYWSIVDIFHIFYCVFYELHTTAHDLHTRKGGLLSGSSFK
jgi:hypothetical protein